MKLSDCCQSFQEDIASLAELSGKTVDAVHEEWIAYCKDCMNFDQSPVMFEFCEWYGYDGVMG